MEPIRRKIYVTEPDMIDMDEARRLLPVEQFELIAGDTEFTKDYDAAATVLLIRSETHVGRDILEHFPKLEHVVRVGVGLDNVDQDFLTSHNIKIHNAPGANADAVAEYVVTIVLGVLRHTTPLSTKDVLAWDRLKFMGHSVSAQTVGIVGFGHIGRLLHTKLVGLGCEKFIIYDPYLPGDMELDHTIERTDSLETLLQESTVVSLHLPLLSSTKYIINKTRLAMMQDNAILVNAARGGIVNEAELLEVLEQKPLFYIADTVENEPEVNPALVDHERITVTPHIASLTHESNENMLRVALQNFLAATQ